VGIKVRKFAVSPNDFYNSLIHLTWFTSLVQKAQSLNQFVAAARNADGLEGKATVCEFNALILKWAF